MTAAACAGPALVEEVLRRFGTARLRAGGGSMRPAIRPGDVLCIARTGLDDVTRGDVVVFRRDGRLFAHRVVRIDGRGLQTRGDAHWREDPRVSEAELLGRVTAIERDGVPRPCPPPGRWRALAIPRPRAASAHP